MIDAHHHFWRYTTEEFGWIPDNWAAIQRDFLVPELMETVAGTGVTGVISVQARTALVETAFLLEQAALSPLVLGIVGWLPLKDAGVGELLDQYLVHAKFKGVREVMQGAPDGLFFEDAEFNRGIRELTKRGLPYDLLVFGSQLPSAIKFVDAHPQQSFILDHIAKPVIERDAFDTTWARDMASLAERENVVCKFSGVVTEVRDAEWDIELLRPYFDTALEAFGSDRLLFGSDWPVCLARSPYTQWVKTVGELASKLSDSDRNGIFSANAARVYTVSV